MALIELSKKAKDFIGTNQAKWLVPLLEESVVPTLVPKQKKYCVVTLTSDGEGHVLVELYKSHPGEHLAPPLEVEAKMQMGFWKLALRSTYDQVTLMFKEER